MNAVEARHVIAAVLALVLPLSATAEDPLDSVDGTESWEEIDTSSVDEDAAWHRWHEDLRRWEAGRARLDAERARMAELYERLQGPSETAVEEPPPPGRDLQARIDAARRTAQAGGATERDADDQSLDDERPWSTR